MKKRNEGGHFLSDLKEQLSKPPHLLSFLGFISFSLYEII